jgi:hypothetical protein
MSMRTFHFHVKLLILLVCIPVCFTVACSITHEYCVLDAMAKLLNLSPSVPSFFHVYVRAGNLVDQSMTADLAGEVTSAAGPVRLLDLQRILSAIQPSGMS